MNSSCAPLVLPFDQATRTHHQFWSRQFAYYMKLIHDRLLSKVENKLLPDKIPVASLGYLCIKESSGSSNNNGGKQQPPKGELTLEQLRKDAEALEYQWLAAVESTPKRRLVESTRAFEALVKRLLKTVQKPVWGICASSKSKSIADSKEVSCDSNVCLPCVARQCLPELVHQMLDKLEYYDLVVQKRLSPVQELLFWLDQQKGDMDYFSCQLVQNVQQGRLKPSTVDLVQNELSNVLCGTSKQLAHVMMMVSEADLTQLPQHQRATVMTGVVKTRQQYDQVLQNLTDLNSDKTLDLGLGLDAGYLKQLARETEYGRQRLCYVLGVEV